MAAVQLIVGDSVSPGSSDVSTNTILSDLGHTTTYVDEADVINVEGIDLVVICVSITGSTLGSKYRDVTIPVVCLDSGVWEDNYLTNAEGETNHTTPNFDVVDETISGLLTSGNPFNGSTTGTSRQVSDTNLGSGATIVTNVDGFATQVLSFAYETGTTMTTGLAPARRVGIGLNYQYVNDLSADGLTMIESFISWALGIGDVTLTAEPTTLRMISGDATLTSDKNSEPANAWFNGETFGANTWGNPSTWWGPVDTNIPLLAEPTTLRLISGDATLTVETFNFELIAESTTLRLISGDATLTTQSFIRTSEVQGALDSDLGESVIDIYKKDRQSPYVHWYCVGNSEPFIGKCMWVRTIAGETPAAQAAEIATVMNQSGNYDPDIS